jgi:hypothetical protein
MVEGKKQQIEEHPPLAVGRRFIAAVRQRKSVTGGALFRVVSTHRACIGPGSIPLRMIGDASRLLMTNEQGAKPVVPFGRAWAPRRPDRAGPSSRDPQATNSAWQIIARKPIVLTTFLYYCTRSVPGQLQHQKENLLYIQNATSPPRR